MASPNNARDEEEGEEDIELEEDVEQPAPSTQKKKKKLFGKKPKKGDAEAAEETKKIKKEADQVEGLSAEEAFERYGSSEDGLTDAEAKDRLNKYGRNAIEDHHQGPIKKFLSFFYNPLAGAMWVAAIISFLATDFLDFGLIIALLVFNAAIGYWEEARAGNAIAALKAQLALKATVRRNGADWEEIEAETLVPGDVVQLASGNVVPADCKVIGGQQLKVDQSSLTGESLPATKQPGNAVYSGSTIKQGEGEGLVYATGKNTYFGRSAGLVASTTTEGHYKQLLSAFGWFCSIFITLFVVLELITQYGIRGKTCGRFFKYNYCPTLANLVVLIAGGVPIAMPTVLSVTMAIGAGVLAKQKAIVSRLTAVEDLASMDCLCSDKTGTLTKNKLEMDVPFLCKGGDWDLQQLLLDACLATDYKARVMDPIDDAILKYQDRWDEINAHELIDFTPFDPVSKRTFSKVKSPNGDTFVVAKGAPQVILESATNKAEIEADVEAKILEFAKRGFRSLGVGRLKGEAGQSEAWEMEGLIPLFDPPRDDTKATIQKAIALGVRVKMLTGDQQAIAEETARRLGMGTLIMNAKQFQNDEDTMTEEAFSEEIERYDGFSQVRPEHKFEIVAKLQERGHIVAMTGDGVNDAPALKKANIGFAVADATEAARSASDIVLTAPGLSVMITAIEGSRKIFERMKNYSTYTISVTVRVVLVFSILTFAYDWYFPTVLVLIIAILNDGTILTISKDRVRPAPLPDKWNFRELFILAFLLGFWQVISTIVLFVVIKQTHFFTNVGLRPLSDDTLRALIYLQVSISGQATIFVTRTRGWSYFSRPAYPVLAAFVIAQTIATFLGVYGLNGFPNDGVSDVHGHGWGWALCAWLWVLCWYWPMDLIKFFCQSIVFKANIPLIHPYSPEDKARDEQLEAMSKAAIEERKRLGFKDIGEDDDDFDEDVNPVDPVDDDVDATEEVDESKINVHTPLTTRQATGTPQIGRNTPQAARSTPQFKRNTPTTSRLTPSTNRVPPETQITPNPSSPHLSSSGNMRRPYTQQNV